MRARFGLVAALALAACTVKTPAVNTGKSTPTPTPSAPVAVKPAPTPTPAPALAGAQVAGLVSAPAGVLANNGAGVVSNNSSSIISEHGAGFQLAAVEQQPLAGAKVYLADAAGNPIPGVEPALTDAAGRYKLAGAPVGYTFQVRVEVKTAAGKPAGLGTLVETTAVGSTADVSLASTFVTTAVIDGQGGSLGDFNGVTYQAAVDATEQELDPQTLPDLADRAAILAWMSRLEARVKAIQAALDELKRDVADIKSSLERIEKKLDASPSPTPTPTPVPSPTPALATLAGSPTQGFKDGPAAQAQFYKPVGVVVDAAGGVYVSELFNHAIRRIAPDGNVTTIGGTGQAGHQDGPAKQALFAAPAGLAINPDGNLYVAEYAGNDVRRITPAGQVVTLAGTGVPGGTDGAANLATFAGPTGIARDPDQNLYVAEFEGHRIRRIAADGTVTTLAGDGSAGWVDGKGAAAKFNRPYGIAWDASTHSVVVADSANNVLRRVAADGTVTTIAGGSEPGWKDGPAAEARFWSPLGVAVDGKGVIYVGDNKNARLRRIKADGMVETLAGTGVAGYNDGPAADAVIGAPYLMSLDAKGGLVFADYPNQCIRRLAPLPAAD